MNLCMMQMSFFYVGMFNIILGSLMGSSLFGNISSNLLLIAKLVSVLKVALSKGRAW